MSFTDKMVSATLLSSDLKLEHLLRSEAMEENKNLVSKPPSVG